MASLDREVQELLDVNGSDSLTLDEIFDILSNKRRRFLLTYLQNNDEPVTIRELSEELAAVENGTTTEALSSKERKRVYIALHQCHLPKMDNLSIVTYDQSRGAIECGENANEVIHCLARINEQPEPATIENPPWATFFLGLTGLGMLVLVISHFAPVAFLPPELVLAAVSVIFGIFLGLYARTAMETGTYGRTWLR